ncbi:hypothetical protein IEQ34_021896 [Dendrobium chrysotoxum]|uniref:Uncharacterized protein n=1 Tax=Dendrobium chrysotoxum TaxID=161865 RepID=A0AAV7FVL1_DENCH|nr:hypothetical protein IEQ34_021896 [Dendrobium chrysotoxum]
MVLVTLLSELEDHKCVLEYDIALDGKTLDKVLFLDAMPLFHRFWKINVELWVDLFIWKLPWAS